MSNRQRLRRPRRRPNEGLARAVAAAYSCGHCRAVTRVRAELPALVLVDVLHDPGCPVLGGAVDPVPAAARAALAGLRGAQQRG